MILILWPIHTKKICLLLFVYIVYLHPKSLNFWCPYLSNSSKCFWKLAYSRSIIKYTTKKNHPLFTFGAQGMVISAKSLNSQQKNLGNSSKCSKFNAEYLCLAFGAMKRQGKFFCLFTSSFVYFPHNFLHPCLSRCPLGSKERASKSKENPKTDTGELANSQSISTSSDLLFFTLAFEAQ